MSATKILWGQIAVVLLIVLIAMWAATEWTAWRLGFQPQLGDPWFTLFGMPIYIPPAFFGWWFVYEAYAPGIFVEGAFIAASGGFLSIAVAIVHNEYRDVTSHYQVAEIGAELKLYAKTRGGSLVVKDQRHV